jgi:hypothetical protein
VLSTHRRLIAVLGTTAAVAAGLTVSSAIHGAASTPSASDLCVIAPPVWVHNQQVYPGGLYCVPVPDPSQATS